MNDNHHNQGRRHNSQPDHGHNHNCPATSRKLALENPFLAVKVALEPEQQNQDADAQERRPERSAQALQRVFRMAVAAVGEGRVESEELSYGNANRCKS